MSLENTKNGAQSVMTAAGLDASALTFSVILGGGAKFPSAATRTFQVVIWNKTDYADPNDDPEREYVEIDPVSDHVLTDTFAISTGKRGQQDTTAVAHNIATKVYGVALVIHSKMIEDINTWLAALEASLNAVIVMITAINSDMDYRTLGLIKEAPATGAINGLNMIFTFTHRPVFLFSDLAPSSEEDDYTVAGSGPYTVTFLAVPPVAKLVSFYNSYDADIAINIMNFVEGDEALVAGIDGYHWSVAHTPIGPVTLFAVPDGIRLRPGASDDYTISGKDIISASDWSASPPVPYYRYYASA
jgi:hypothetical protein